MVSILPILLRQLFFYKMYLGREFVDIRLLWFPGVTHAHTKFYKGYHCIEVWGCHNVGHVISHLDHM